MKVFKIDDEILVNKKISVANTQYGLFEIQKDSEGRILRIGAFAYTVLFGDKEVGVSFDSDLIRPKKAE